MNYRIKAKDEWTNMFLEVVSRYLVHIYCDYSTYNIFEMRGEYKIIQVELERV